MQRLQVRYEGRVQGVGFRLTVAELAKGFPVSGRVCNVADGSVELVAEGEASDLEDFHQAIVKRMSRNVVKHQTHWREIQQMAFDDFAIGEDKFQR